MLERPEVPGDLAGRGAQELGRQRDPGQLGPLAGEPRARRAQPGDLVGEKRALAAIALEQQAGRRAAPGHERRAVAGCGVAGAHRGAQAANARDLRGGQLVADGRERTLDRRDLVVELTGQRIARRDRGAGGDGSRSSGCGTGVLGIAAAGRRTRCEPRCDRREGREREDGSAPAGRRAR